MDYDVVIVGAGPAGCAAAYDLCVSGKSLLLLDKHEFPRGKAIIFEKHADKYLDAESLAILGMIFSTCLRKKQ